jgi:hypothetical protein
MLHVGKKLIVRLSEETADGDLEAMSERSAYRPMGHIRNMQTVSFSAPLLTTERFCFKQCEYILKNIFAKSEFVLVICLAPFTMT